MKNCIKWFLDSWCKFMHQHSRHTSWPIHGKYHCFTCLRKFEAPMN